MKIRKFANIIAAAALVATPLAAQARGSAPVDESESAIGSTLLILVAIVSAVTVGAIVIADDNPTSP